MKAAPPATLVRRKSPRQARSAATVDAVFEATIQVLLSHGSARLNTTRVALRAGVSVGTLYQYFPNKQALLFAVLERHLGMIVAAVEAACGDHRGAPVDAMAEAVVKAYLQAKTRESEVSSVLYLVAVEFDARELIEAATLRGEEAIAAMLSTASDGHFGDPYLVARTLLAAIHGAVRTFYERDMPPTIGGEAERQLTLMCRSYLFAAREGERGAASVSGRAGQGRVCEAPKVIKAKVV